MRNNHQLRSYVWRVERQFNGNVHFHITTDSWLPHDNIKDTWNWYLKPLGFIDKFRQNNTSEHPNSTDVHSVNAIRNLASYMVKYMTKDPKQMLKHHNSQRAKAGLKAIRPEDHPWQKIKGQPTWDQPISGKVWDCSKNLKTKERALLEMSRRDFEWWNYLRKECPDRFTTLDSCSILRLSEAELKNSGYPEYHKVYRNWIESVYNNARKA